MTKKTTRTEHGSEGETPNGLRCKAGVEPGGGCGKATCTDCYEPVPKDAAHRCDSCGWEGTRNELQDIADWLERVSTEDDITPSGQCPRCRALTFVYPSRWIARPWYAAYVGHAGGGQQITLHETYTEALGEVADALLLDTTDSLGDDLSDEDLEQRIEDHCNARADDWHIEKLEVEG